MMGRFAKRWVVFLLSALLLSTVLACTEEVSPQAQPSSVPLPSPPTLAPQASVTPSAAVKPTATPPRFKSPTPPANPGTTESTFGQYRIVSNAKYYWSLRLPRDWVITYDRGFELFANNPGESANLRLLSQVWPSPKERLPTARDYVAYWKKYTYGDVFPVYAKGAQVSESTLSPGKFGGPYLRYEFDDRRNAVRYVQVYASGGGPNSVVLTGWAKHVSFESVKSTLDDILASLELLKPP